MVNDSERPDERANPPDDATRPMRPVDGGEPDATVVGGAPVSGPPDDRTVVGGAPVSGAPLDATAVSEPAEPGEPRWTARANVPPPGSAPVRRPAPQEWVEEDPYGGKSWLRPVIIGILVLMLVGALLTGVWLIYRATSDGSGGTPADSPSATETLAPTSAAPTSAAPSVTASPTGPPSPVEVTIPALRGDQQAEATAKLRALGLNVAITQREDPTLSPGQVIDTNPGPGETVTTGQTVTLIVAKAPAPSPTRTTRSPSPSASAGG